MLLFLILNLQVHFLSINLYIRMKFNFKILLKFKKINIVLFKFWWISFAHFFIDFIFLD